MSETFAEYAQRIRGYLGGKDPLQSMQEAPMELATLLQGVSESAWSKSLSPGKWSIGQIVAHLADSELVAGYRFRTIAAADDSAPIAGYDQDRWAAVGNYGSVRLDASLKSFLVLRDMNLRFLRSLSANAWQKCGIHSERGRESLRDHVLLIAGHDLSHMAQIRNILGDSESAGAKT